MTMGSKKWFRAQRGFGSIAADGGNSDAFIHVSAVERSGIAILQEDRKLGIELLSDFEDGKASETHRKLLM